MVAVTNIRELWQKMKKEFFGKAGSYALIPLGVGVGQYFAGLFIDEKSSSVLCIAITSLLASLVTFALLLIFFAWWGSKSKNLGKSESVPIFWSPILWVPVVFVAVYLAHRVVNA